ncbi:MAG: hypothetical protein WCL08_00315 [Verrucomicrobiota bacterium]
MLKFICKAIKPDAGVIEPIETENGEVLGWSKPSPRGGQEFEFASIEAFNEAAERGTFHHSGFLRIIPRIEIVDVPDEAPKPVEVAPVAETTPVIETQPEPELEPVTIEEGELTAPAPEGMPPIQTLRSIVANGPKMRLKDHAHKLNVEPDALRVLIETPDSGLAIANAGWVSLAE